MKKLTSINYSPAAFNFALVVLRVCAGVLLAAHGYDKLVHFAQYSSQFTSFLGLSAKASLSLSIFAEFFCSIFVILGLFTRPATIPILINMATAMFKVHNADFFGQAEKASLFFLIFFVV